MLGELALRLPVFAGHLQDALFSVMLVGVYAVYRTVTEQGLGGRTRALTAAAILVGVGVLVSAVQWTRPRSCSTAGRRRVGPEDLVFGSWHPEMLLQMLVVREAYGTRTATRTGRTGSIRRG